SCGLVSMLLVGWSSDRTGERRWHTALPILAASLGMGLAIAAGGKLPTGGRRWHPALPILAASLGMGLAIAAGANVPLVVACFCLVSIGVHSYLPSFWAMPTAFLTESAAAAAIGLINSVGNLRGGCRPLLLRRLGAR